MTPPKIVLAYSGGLDTSIAIPWLRERHGADVVALALDLGQAVDRHDLQARALAAGAASVRVVDAREEFARDFAAAALRADAFYEDRCPMSRALGQAFVAGKLVEVAAVERASAVAHGCRGGDARDARVDASLRALAPALPVHAPAREWGMDEAGKRAYAHARGIHVPASDEWPGTDVNIWGRSIEIGPSGPPWTDTPGRLYRLTSTSRAPGEPAHADLVFEAGTPTALNGVPMSLVDLIDSLNTIAGLHGIGRLDVAHVGPDGARSRVIGEAPAAVLLHTAHHALQRATLPGASIPVWRQVSDRYVALVDGGQWFTPARTALDALVAKAQQAVAGVVRLELWQGTCRIVERRLSGAGPDPALALSLAADARQLVTM